MAPLWLLFVALKASDMYSKNAHKNAQEQLENAQERLERRNREEKKRNEREQEWERKMGWVGSVFLGLLFIGGFIGVVVFVGLNIADMFTLTQIVSIIIAGYLGLIVVGLVLTLCGYR
jgi:hypothetical protein